MSPQSSGSRPPNIVLTIADDQRGTALGCAGVEPVVTPALDALAARGTRYRNAQHLGSCHGAICAPSRAMLHTGRPYFQLDRSLLGAERLPVEDPAKTPPTLGERLRAAGYDCFATGKWHNGVESFGRSFGAARDVFFGGMADHWFTPVQDFDPTGEYPRDQARRADGFSTEVFSQAAIDFIRSRRDDDRPFFCYCAFTAPHDPRTPPDRWRRRYAPDDMPLPPNIRIDREPTDAPPGARPRLDNGTLSMRDELLLGTPRDAAELRRSIAEYYGMVSDMDEWIGRIHAILADTGRLDNTLVIHTADHGLAVGQHGFLGKQNLHQHSVNVPLIVAGPDIPAGVVSDELCYQHDLHPTLLHRAGLVAGDTPFHRLGTGHRETIATAFRDEQRCIRDERHKLIEYRLDGVRMTELYDLADDPWETRDLANAADLQPVVARLRDSLRRWQHEHGDTADWI